MDQRANEGRKRQASGDPAAPTGHSSPHGKTRPGGSRSVSAPASMTAATDAEVDEFYRLVRELHIVRSRLNKQGDRDRSRGRSPECWKPEFQIEDFGVLQPRKVEEDRPMMIDLNVEPEDGCQ